MYRTSSLRYIFLLTSATVANSSRSLRVLGRNLELGRIQMAERIFFLSKQVASAFCGPDVANFSHLSQNRITPNFQML
jgi:hypothetical protein